MNLNAVTCVYLNRLLFLPSTFFREGERKFKYQIFAPLNHPNERTYLLFRFVQFCFDNYSKTGMRL